MGSHEAILLAAGILEAIVLAVAIGLFRHTWAVERRLTKLETSFWERVSASDKWRELHHAESVDRWNSFDKQITAIETDAKATRADVSKVLGYLQAKNGIL